MCSRRHQLFLCNSVEQFKGNCSLVIVTKVCLLLSCGSKTSTYSKLWNVIFKKKRNNHTEPNSIVEKFIVISLDFFAQSPDINITVLKESWNIW